MLNKVRVGRQDFFSMQRAYGTLKQNLVQFKYTQVIN